MDWFFKFFSNDHALELVLILSFSLLSFVITRKYLLALIKKVASKTKNQWDDIILSKNVFFRLSYLMPAIILHVFSEKVISSLISFDINFLEIDLFKRMLTGYILLVVLFVIDSLLTSFLTIYNNYEISKRIPIKGYLQLVKIFVFCIGAVLVISAILDKSPNIFIGGLSALTAVLLLIFKNSILSLVANIQITTNGLIKVGDWLEIPKFGVDGEVIEISLNTLKIQNWDKTYSFVPMHVLLDEAYKNWSGMVASGGRRIKRAIKIDITSISYCDEETLEKYKKFKILQPYLEGKIEEIKKFNEENNVDYSSVINGRRLTNIGTFRAYIKAYLANHPKVHKEMTFLVRQLEPTEKGLPIEIYIFLNETRWVQYEDIQADIFDHLFAALKEFGLRGYQAPSSFDFEKLAIR
jgi:miniconductance mechanosensitive channel